MLMIKDHKKDGKGQIDTSGLKHYYSYVLQRHTFVGTFKCYKDKQVQFPYLPSFPQSSLAL